MKFCEKCGKEILEDAVVCPNCGCAVKKEEVKKEVNYADLVKGSSTTNIIGIIVLAVGIIVGLFLSVLVGCILCLAAEFIILSPRNKLNKAIKQNNQPITDKKAFKAESKRIQKEVGQQNGAFKVSMVFAIIALIGVVLFALMI